jgi:hypothetical protein
MARLTSMVIALALVVAAYTAHAGSTVHNTPSGRPEVTIDGKVAKVALGEITNEMINVSYLPKIRSETGAIFDKPLDRGEAFLIGGIGEARPVRRVTFDIIELDTSTRILASYSIVTNPGGGNGRAEKATVHDDTNESVQWQEILNKIKSRIEKK